MSFPASGLTLSPHPCLLWARLQTPRCTALVTYKGSGDETIDSYGKPIGQCERNPLCSRGFKHQGHGGHCKLTKTERSRPVAAKPRAQPRGEGGGEGGGEGASEAAEELLDGSYWLGFDELNGAGVACLVCGEQDDDEGNAILLCDGHGCSAGYHLRCLEPALEAVPEHEWLCPTCADSGQNHFVERILSHTGDGASRRYRVRLRLVGSCSLAWAPSEGPPRYRFASTPV